MKNVKIVSSVIATALIVSLSGCGVEEEKESLYPEKPTISVTNLEVVNSGSEIRWQVSVNNKHQSTNIKVGPWNDSTYFFSSLQGTYNDSVELDCNSNVQGVFVDCNDIDEIVCDRVSIGSDYSEYRCDYRIDGVLYPQYKEKMRIPTMSNDDPSEQVLMTLGTEYWYELNGYESSKYVFETDETKMFNVYSGEAGPQ